ncbi:helix-turn-helix domain-containing protein [Georgenia yuyongxinii]|uniref:Helix-turn-helix domain-containing protein n=2 Tax=Georgenia yuyongxinii TaxID=2589797 RepID=A0A5B8CEG5_9MICO|nr:helix-turn-helix domain-containing protein [Georgenia yuyongxinii]
MRNTAPRNGALPLYVSIKEAAAAKGVTERTIRRWIATNHLSAERVGPRLIRIRVEDLEQMGHRIGGAA